MFISIKILTFEMLLQEFLKKEFSDENIVFWIACENFRNITDFEEVRKLFCVTTCSLYTNNYHRLTRHLNLTVPLHPGV